MDSQDARLVRCWCGAVFSQYSEFDRAILLYAECPVICQMQQLLVSMETTHGPFSVFSSSLCEEKKKKLLGAEGNGGV